MIPKLLFVLHTIIFFYPSSEMDMHYYSWHIFAFVQASWYLPRKPVPEAFRWKHDEITKYAS